MFNVPRVGSGSLGTGKACYSQAFGAPEAPTMSDFLAPNAALRPGLHSAERAGRRCPLERAVRSSISLRAYAGKCGPVDRGAATGVENRHPPRGPCNLRMSGDRRALGRGDRIRTCDPLLPKQMRYRTAPLPDPTARPASLGARKQGDNGGRDRPPLAKPGAGRRCRNTSAPQPLRGPGAGRRRRKAKAPTARKACAQDDHREHRPAGARHDSLTAD